MQRYFIFVFLIYLFPMYANSAENAMAMIDFENSESIQIAGDEKNCLLTHQNKNDSDVTVFSISTTKENKKHSMRIDIGTEYDEPVDELIIERGEVKYYAQSPYDLLMLEIETKQDELSDDELDDLYDSAEAADGKTAPEFAEVKISVDGQPFKDFVKNTREAERFPKPRTAKVSINIDQIAVAADSADPSNEKASVIYTGSCKVALMSE